MNILENMIALNIWHYFFLMKNMIEFLIELDISLWQTSINKYNISNVYSQKYMKIEINSDRYYLTL